MNKTENWSFIALCITCLMLTLTLWHAIGYQKGVEEGINVEKTNTFWNSFDDDFQRLRIIYSFCKNDKSRIAMDYFAPDFTYVIDCQTFMRLYKEQNPVSDILYEKVTDEYGNVVKNGELRCSLSDIMSSSTYHRNCYAIK